MGFKDEIQTLAAVQMGIDLTWALDIQYCFDMCCRQQQIEHGQYSWVMFGHELYKDLD